MGMESTAEVINPSQGAGSEAGGEPKGSTEGTGEPGGSGSAKGEQGGAGLFDGMTPETLHRSYKELQKQYSQIQNDVVKKFAAYGGPEQVLQWTQYLSNNPSFAEWVTAQRNKNATGIDESQLDDQTKAALDTVRKIARSVVEEEVGKVRQQEIGPLTEAAKQTLLASHFDSMDKAYGEEWHEMRDLMSELSENLPAEIQDHPTFDDVEDLYFKALRKSNKLESYAAKKLKQSIDTKKGKATDKPGVTGESTPKRATSIAEAFRQAQSGA